MGMDIRVLSALNKNISKDEQRMNDDLLSARHKTSLRVDGDRCQVGPALPRSYRGIP
jgi:hypothetical protein